jgi:hypothetical protein
LEVDSDDDARSSKLEVEVEKDADGDGDGEKEMNNPKDIKPSERRTREEAGLWRTRGIKRRERLREVFRVVMTCVSESAENKSAEHRSGPNAFRALPTFPEPRTGLSVRFWLAAEL